MFVRDLAARPRTPRWAVLGATLLGLLAPAANAASAQATSPWWHLTSGSRPTVLPSAPGSKGQIVLTATNLGDAATGGEVTLTDKLPKGLKALSISGAAEGSGSPGPVKCAKLPSLTCALAASLPPYSQIEVRVRVEALPGAHSGELNEGSVSGGGAESDSISRPLTISEEATTFGVEDYEITPEEKGGQPATQAGSHPFQLTTTLTLNQSAEAKPPALLKDLHVKLPVGLIGNPTAVPRCSLAQFLAVVENGSENGNACPPQSAIGVFMPIVNIPNSGVIKPVVPLFNLEPSAGEPARFGALVTASDTPILLDTSIRSGSGEDYGATVSVLNTTEAVSFISSQATFWGAPGDPSHDAARGWGCIEASRGRSHLLPCAPLEQRRPPPLLTLPTSCSGAPLPTSVQLNSWADPADFLPPFAASPPLSALDGCNRLPFAPIIAAEPTSNAAASSTGLNFDLNFPNEGLTNSSPGAIAESELKKAVVTLPEGFTANPSVAEGLKACSLHEYESATVQAGTGCTPESKIGSVEVESPLVTQKIDGSLYVAKQRENPFGSLLALYMVLRNPELGVLVKVAGKVEAGGQQGVEGLQPGQLRTTFDNLPQLPFSHFHLSFRQGQRSPLITPPACGEYTVKADLYPYANPTEPLPEKSSFQITQGPEGQGCPSNGVPPFHPGLEAGTTNNAAGSYSPFYIHISRKDSEQEITHFSIKLPPGVVGKLAGIPFCSDAGIEAAKSLERVLGGGGEEEASPSCPPASEVGHTLVGAGVGNVLAYAPGKLYLAGPYKGAPISIVSITAAKVGPFDLGTVVVREALKVNPETAEAFVDATGSDPIPHIVDGIPVHLRDIRIHVNRPEFVLNPTSCEPTSTASTVLGSGLDFASEADDVPVTVTSRFQAADCASLPFGPKLSLKLLGATKRTAHPALKATLRMNGIGEAAIARAQVTLPKSEFLDQGHIRTVCTRVQFKEAGGNGAGCPAASVYGYARAVTPILTEPLEGPVYLRSSEHQLPDLVAALHGQEINVDLVGRIDSLHGQIRNTFEAVPDAPVTSFTLEMQGGSKGLLINSTNLCQGKHKAIVDFTGHNGKIEDFNPAVGAKCPKGNRKGKHRHGRARRHR